MTYKVGDTVWVGTFENRETQVVCPICAGSLTVTLILGNGDVVVLPCENCKRGFDGPFGTVAEYERIPRAEIKFITSVRTMTGPDGTVVEYTTTDQYCYESGKVFDSQAAALAYAQTLADEAARNESERAEHIKANTNKNYSWNAGYHLREANKARESAERHERLAVLCKAKAKSEVKPS